LAAADVFGASRQVNLTVKAHSGSRIYLHEDEIEAYRKTEDDINKFHYPEINLSFPSITAQIDAARKEYESSETVDLILLSWGITDVLVANTVNPFINEKKMREFIHKYCNEAMQELLEQAVKTFPNAVMEFNEKIKKLFRFRNAGGQKVVNLTSSSL
jgi:serine/threonine protein phosphatase PrpC